MRLTGREGGGGPINSRIGTAQGWILAISYCDVIVSNVTGVLTSRLSTDEASANRILMTSSEWPYVFSTWAYLSVYLSIYLSIYLSTDR